MVAMRPCSDAAFALKKQNDKLRQQMEAQRERERAEEKARAQALW